MTLILKKHDADAIMDHCFAVYPTEACGIIVGRREDEHKIVERVLPTRNILNSTSAYQVDPEEQYRAFLEAEAAGLEVLGFYHSHPYWTAEPSHVDKAQAHYPDHSYLIYSVPEKRLKSFIFLGGEFHSEPLEIIEN
ncbi:MAG: M67 family metallopeptidase [Candidatus Bathyarchaeia archaeon]